MGSAIGGAINNGASAQANRTLSRIEQDTEAVKNLSERIEIITTRITAHARALGYFGPPQDAKQVGVQPTVVTITLADALTRMSNEIERCSAALNVFD